MKLIYNGVDLAQLGELRVLGTATERAGEAPQRYRVTVRCRLDVFQSSYEANAAVLESARAAFRTQQAQLVWQDDSGKGYVERTVTVAGDESPEETGGRGGTYWQALTFSFWYWEHQVVSGCLQATVRAGAAPDVILGTVEKWEEKRSAQFFSELFDPVKQVTGVVTASGRWQADTSGTVEARRAELLAAKAAMEAQLVAGQEKVQVSYGSFDRQVKVTEFRAEVDQPFNSVGWTLSFTYVGAADGQDFLALEYRVTTRESRGEGVVYLGLRGRVVALTEASARAKLALLKGSVVPTSYAGVSEETDPQYVTGQWSGAEESACVELGFSLEFRDTATLATSFQRDGAGAPTLDLGTVDRFTDRYVTQLFDEMKSLPRRVGGQVTLMGRWYVPESVPAGPARTAALVAKKAQFDTELKKGISGRLIYGAVFNQVVKVLDFTCELNKVKWYVEWNLTGSFTRWPNEANHTIVDVRLEQGESKVEGTVVLGLSGRIVAHSEEAAREKLARVRAQLVPAGYVLLEDRTASQRVDVETDGGKRTMAQSTFIELAIADTWQKSGGNVQHWQIKVSEDDDARSGWVRTVYSGWVQASGATLAVAIATAKAKAAELGDGKHAFKVRSLVAQDERYFQTSGGVVFGRVEFSYEYQRRGTKRYLEVTAELNADALGQTVEHVNGYVAAATLEEAQALYEAAVRAGYAQALILQEKRPTRSEVGLYAADYGVQTSAHDRYVFGLAVLRSQGTTAITYAVETVENVLSLERVTTVDGVVRAPTQALAEAFLEAYVTAWGALGKRVKPRRRVETVAKSLVAGGAQVEVFGGLHFGEEFHGTLTGPEGVLECEVSEEVMYSADRLVERPLPDGPSIIQRCGVTCGRRGVSARAVATTEAAGVEWVKGMRTALLSAEAGRYEEPPRLTVGWRFLPLTQGVPRGAGMNVRVAEVTGMFGELLPNHRL